ncbi:MAG: metal-dependent transcriptional regulator [Planctomycetota bacterium]
MPSSTVEDYVKSIYALQRDAPTGEATVARIAATLGVTKGSVTSMVRKLREARLVDAQRYGGIKLTKKGQTLALDVIRRHRIIEVFLVEVLGFDWSEVHEEAERLEHAMSAKLLDRLDEHLGRPAIDPHGEPIPDAHGRIDPDPSIPLTELEPDQSATIASIRDSDPALLERVKAIGLTPGTRVMLVSRSRWRLTVKPGRRPPVELRRADAERCHVRPAP